MGRGKRKSFKFCVDESGMQNAEIKELKKLHKVVLCKNSECPHKTGLPAITLPFGIEDLTHPEGRVAVKKRNFKSIVNMRGDSNLPDQRKLFKKKKRKRVTIVEPQLTKYVYKGDLYDSPIRNEVPYDDNWSLKSMLRRNKTYPYSKCGCVGKILFNDEKAQTETVLIKNKKIGKKRKQKKHKKEIYRNLDGPKTDIKLVMKPKNIELQKPKVVKKSRKAKSPLKQPQPTLIDNMKVTASPKIGNTKNKMAGIYSKYSKNMLSNIKINLKNEEPTPLNVAVCDEGICKSAVANRTESFFCRCLRKTIRECTDQTCKENDKKKSPESGAQTRLCDPSCRKSCFKSSGQAGPSKAPKSCEPTCRKPCFKEILKGKFRSGSEPFDDNYNKCDQTGEPFMEIKVDSVNMSVLNPNEIKGKVIDLSKICKGNPSCRCSSHMKRRGQMIDKDLCEGGVCHKTFKNKKTSFNCKCQKTAECTDNTCNPDSPYPSNFRPLHEWRSELGNPTFEVKLDSKRMHVLNSNEIHQKIKDIETESKEMANTICPDGMCGAAKAGNQTYFKCKCVERKRKPGDISECSEATCAIEGAQYPETRNSELVCYLLSKIHSLIGKKKRSRMTRRSFNPIQMAKIKSIFSMSSRQKKNPRRSAPNPYSIQNIPNSHGMHKREGLKLNLGKTHSESCTCNVCNAKVQASLGARCKSIIMGSISGLFNRQKYTVNNANYHRRDNVSIPTRYQLTANQPLKKQKRQTQYSLPSGNFAQVTNPEIQQTEIEKKHNDNNICACSNICECADIMDKRRRKKKQSEHESIKKHKHEIEKDKESEIADQKLRKIQEKKDHIEAQKRIKQYRQEQKEMKELAKQDETSETNCLVDFILGVVRLAFNITKGLLILLFKGIFKPKKSYKFMRQRVRDPKGTWTRFNLWASDKWLHQKFRMDRTIKGSRTMTILADEVRNSDLYHAFSYKGKTPEERLFIASAEKKRRKRIEKRQDEAIYGCRHMLLVTMRKRPCLWVYHICPAFYPQFLSARMFLLNFCQMSLFCLAVLVWTPCIACCELCRGLLCCMVCTR